MPRKKPAGERKLAPRPTDAEMAAYNLLFTSKLSDNFSEVVRAADQVVQMFETALEILQAAQSTIPAPTLEEVAEIRQGKRPLTQKAYLLGSLQRVILGAENVVSDLRAIDLETLGNVHEMNLSGVELNAIEQAVTERTQKGVRKREGEDD